MSIIGFVRVQPMVPPPGVVHELAERVVEFVQRALGVTLDYTPETLPLLDHYLGEVPHLRAEMVDLVATCAGAYFGEVLRRELGGEWLDTDTAAPSAWRLELSGQVRLTPVGLATLAILEAETEGVDGEYDVPDAARESVQAGLDAVGEVPEDEYYSLCGRFEALQLVVDRATDALRPRDPPS